VVKLILIRIPGLKIAYWSIYDLVVKYRYAVT
jgi:hypothetical protein